MWPKLAITTFKASTLILPLHIKIVKQDTKRNFYVWLLREEGRGAYIL